MRYFGYDSRQRVPAPILNIKLINPVTKLYVEKPGKIDSGADLLILPLNVVDELDLPQRGTERVLGYRRDLPPEETPAYYLDVEIAGFYLNRIRAIEASRHDVLIGRNALNKLKVLLDGKNLSFGISDP